MTNNFIQLRLVYLDSASLGLYQYARRMYEPVKIQKFTPATWNRTQDLMTSRPTLNIMTMHSTLQCGRVNKSYRCGMVSESLRYGAVSKLYNCGSVT